MTMDRTWTLASPPATADVYLVSGSGAVLTAPGLPGRALLEMDAQGWTPRPPEMDTGSATWRLTPQDIAALASATRVRIRVDGTVIAGGAVIHVSEWPRWMGGSGRQEIRVRIDGLPGRDGVGIAEVSRTAQGEILLRLTDGRAQTFPLPTGGGGGAGVGIASITQPAPAQMSVTLTDGRTQDISLPAGPRGADGQPGADGPAGADGKPGADGRAGADGARGADGAAGVGISTITQPTATTARVTLTDGRSETLTLPAGPRGADGPRGTDGTAGAAGVGISSITQPAPAQMAIALTDGRSQSLTLPAGPAGPAGAANVVLVTDYADVATPVDGTLYVRVIP